MIDVNGQFIIFYFIDAIVVGFVILIRIGIANKDVKYLSLLNMILFVFMVMSMIEFKCVVYYTYSIHVNNWTIMSERSHRVNLLNCSYLYLYLYLYLCYPLYVLYIWYVWYVCVSFIFLFFPSYYCYCYCD